MSRNYKTGSKEWENHLKAKVFVQSTDIDDSGWMVRGYVGEKMLCRYCGSERYDDGTRCKSCGMYHRAMANKQATEMEEGA